MSQQLHVPPPPQSEGWDQNLRQPPPPAGSGPWWQKKRFILPLGILSLILVGIIVGELGTPADEDAPVSLAEGPSDADEAAPEGADEQQREVVPEPVMVSVPTLIGEGRDDAVAALEGIGLEARILERETEDAAEGEVVDQRPDPDATVEEGDTVTLYIAAAPPPPPEPDGSNPDSPLAIGDSARVGSYEVAIVDFVADATDRIMSENEFNEAPSYDVYSLVTLAVTYEGDETGMPGMDLSVMLNGGDARIYPDYDCMAVEPNSMMDEPDLRRGGAAEGALCLDVPREALDGGVLSVEETFSAPVFWALP